MNYKSRIPHTGLDADTLKAPHDVVEQLTLQIMMDTIPATIPVTDSKSVTLPPKLVIPTSQMS